MNTITTDNKADGLVCTLVCPLAGIEPEQLSRDIEEIGRNINQMVDPSVLKFAHFAPGDYCLDAQGHLYNAWFEVIATGELYPMAVLESEECAAENFNLCVRPDWFDGSIRWIGPAHKFAFQEAILTWADRQFEATRAGGPNELTADKVEDASTNEN